MVQRNKNLGMDFFLFFNNRKCFSIYDTFRKFWINHMVIAIVNICYTNSFDIIISKKKKSKYCLLFINNFIDKHISNSCYRIFFEKRLCYRRNISRKNHLSGFDCNISDFNQNLQINNYK